MPANTDMLVWIDCEMTGLDVSIDELVEVAVVITDYNLVPVDPGFSVVIKPDQSALDNMSEFVLDMHRESGLLDEIPNGMSLADAEFAVNEYIIRHVPLAKAAPLAGNTIGTDRMFLAKYMPRVDPRARLLSARGVRSGSGPYLGAGPDDFRPGRGVVRVAAVIH
jgi:oligoribonuclease